MIDAWEPKVQITPVLILLAAKITEVKYRQSLTGLGELQLFIIILLWKCYLLQDKTKLNIVKNSKLLSKWENVGKFARNDKSCQFKKSCSQNKKLPKSCRATCGNPYMCVLGGGGTSCSALYHIRNDQNDQNIQNRIVAQVTKLRAHFLVGVTQVTKLATNQFW